VPCRPGLGLLLTRTNPLWFWITAFTNNNPMPWPSGFMVKAAEHKRQAMQHYDEILKAAEKEQARRVA
jgi:hypothetical protein